MDQEKKIGCTLSSEVERIIQAKALPREVDTFKGLTIRIMDLIYENELESWQAFLLCKLVSTQIQEEAIMGKKGFTFVSVYPPKVMFLSLCFVAIMVAIVQQEPYLIAQTKYVLMLSVLVACFLLLVSFVHSIFIKMHERKEKTAKI
jgi:hypothetical protein